MVRISGGELCGRHLVTPKGLRVRPTGERVRQAMFNMVQDRLAGCRVLDLFAGSGLLGIEALSRGAATAVFVEKVPDLVRLIRGNLNKSGLGERGEVVCASVSAPYTFGVAANLAEAARFDLVLMDPPYGQGLAAAVLQEMTWSWLLRPDALVIVEHAATTDLLPECRGLRIWKQRRYGGTGVTLFQWDPSIDNNSRLNANHETDCCLSRDF
ncbi:MAG: 16S rRNA (guanine(966)-N(2))-methyltransferase RsmD [Magnetococcales bacterium]|nr:16S rRNA (guanine(966)-N(2))-methyltransferase RsmD [Magnetococcales bacterium]